MRDHQFPRYSFYGFFLTLIALLLVPLRITRGYFNLQKAVHYC